MTLLQNILLILVVRYVGGKSSGIFGEPDPPARTKPMPLGGPASNIFGAAESAPAQSPSRSHPNKPKVGLIVHCDLQYVLFKLLPLSLTLNAPAKGLLNEVVCSYLLPILVS